MSAGLLIDPKQEAKELSTALKRIGLGVGWDRHSIAMGWLLARGADKEVFGFDGLVQAVHDDLRKRGQG